MKHLPYNEPINDKIELTSLGVSMMTCFAGLWYLTGDIGEETKIFLFKIILICNIYFIIMWIRAYAINTRWA